jgi:hypothetical protein
MDNDWANVPFDDNMNRLQFQHLGFVLKLVYDVGLMIFLLD